MRILIYPRDAMDDERQLVGVIAAPEVQRLFSVEELDRLTLFISACYQKWENICARGLIHDADIEMKMQTDLLEFTPIPLYVTFTKPLVTEGDVLSLKSFEHAALEGDFYLYVHLPRGAVPPNISIQTH